LIFENGNISDKIFKDIIDHLGNEDVIVMNNTKVIPARIIGICNNSKIEITLLKKQDSFDEIWEVLAKPAKKLVIGNLFEIAEDFFGEILSKKESGEVIIKFNKKTNEFFECLEKFGRMPLPPYIEKKRKSDKKDNQTYQTKYCNEEKKGSVAAPTAGLHFTEELLQRIKDKGVEIVFVTLHVGGGTFLPVRTENIKEHKMHSEYYEVGTEAAEKINNAKAKGKRVIAVGTTSLRTLESVAQENGLISAKTGNTDIFIYPGYKFKIVDALVTNFHLPKSTLMMLISAFIGLENVKNIYSHAIEKKYRFFSYGDSSLLVRDKIVS
jgi:S-adenosylmethionine:tRNA ribosyltransferase-isomerase